MIVITLIKLLTTLQQIKFKQYGYMLNDIIDVVC